MTKQLSPAAQAVRDAAFSAYWSAEQEAPNDELIIAAAVLRAVAAQMFPINYVVIDNCQYEAPNSEREKILAIAAELEGSN